MSYNLDNFKPIINLSYRSNDLNHFRISVAPSGSVGWSYCNISGFKEDLLKQGIKDLAIKGFEALYNEQDNLLMIKFTNTSTKLSWNTVAMKIKKTVIDHIKYPDRTKLEKNERFDGWYVFGELDAENRAVVYDLNKPVERIKKVEAK